MTRKVLFALLTAVALAGCSRPTPEQQIVNDAAQALGGGDRIAAVKTLIVEGDGTQYNLGQDVTPGASGQTFAVTGYKRAVDVAGGRVRTELTRRPNFTFFQGGTTEAGGWLRRGGGFQRCSQRHRHARVRRGGERSARRAPAPPTHRGARSP